MEDVDRSDTNELEEAKANGSIGTSVGNVDGNDDVEIKNVGGLVNETDGNDSMMLDTS